MDFYRFYTQQTTFDGENYTKGSVVDPLETWNIVCKEFPFERFPEAKQNAKRDWRGSDGLDVYVPATPRFKEYEIEVEFGYVGENNEMHTNIKSFLGYLFGRNGVPSNGAQTQSAGARLWIYDTYTRTGRKDVVATKTNVSEYFLENGADEALSVIRVTFEVYDPVTDIVPLIIDETVTDLVVAQ